jgi:16S rRNA processing protein RimM
LSELEVARVTRPHGIRGLVKVELHWSGSASLANVERLTLLLPSGERREFAVESLRPANKEFLVKLAGVDDRDAADTLRGAKVLMPRSALPALPSGEAYLVDLVGAEVVAPDGLVGEVVRVEVYPSMDTLVVRAPDGRLLEFALAPAFVAKLDPEAKRIELVSRDGLIE